VWLEDDKPFSYDFSFNVGVVPEASTWAMMLLGFAGLGFARYRRAETGNATVAA
jgi:MYXO-CTERM domain-containing protein